MASECLRGCVDMSLPRLISIAAPHYGDKTGRSLVKLAQIVRTDDAAACLYAKQDQQRDEG